MLAAKCFNYDNYVCNHLKQIKQCASAHSEFIQKSQMEPFAKIVDGLQAVNFFAESTILDFWMGFEYASVIIITNCDRHFDGSGQYIIAH